jgi:DNA-binding NarL/FixJ family response regulator
LRELGAERQAAQAEALLKRLRHEREIATDEVPEPQLLSARQTEVLKLIAQGSSDQEIAEKLTLSPHTVHRHVTNILARLDVPSRAAAVASAARQGLI